VLWRQPVSVLAAVPRRDGAPGSVRGMHSVGLVLHPQRDSAEAVDAVLGWATRKEIAVFGIKDEIRRLNSAVVPVTAGELVSLEILLPAFADLVHDHPQLKLKLLAHSAVDDLLRGEADIAVRMFKPEQKALVARRVGAMTLGMWAHRDYVDREGEPGRLEDLARFRIVGPIDETPILRALRGVGFNLPRDVFSLRCNSLATQMLAIRQAMGIGITFNAIATGDAELVRVLPHMEAAMDVFVVMHEDQRGSLAVRVVYEAMVTLLRSALAARPAADDTARAA